MGTPARARGDNARNADGPSGRSRNSGPRASARATIEGDPRIPSLRSLRSFVASTFKLAVKQPSEVVHRQSIHERLLAFYKCIQQPAFASLQL